MMIVQVREMSFNFFPGLYAVVNFLTFVFIPGSKNLIKELICFVPFSKNNSKGRGTQE